MTDWYNIDNFSNQSGFVDIFRIANAYTLDMFGTLFLLGFFVMLMIVLGRYESKHRIVVASFATALVGIIYVPLGLINTWVIYLLVILVTVGVIGLFTSN